MIRKPWLGFPPLILPLAQAPHCAKKDVSKTQIFSLPATILQ